jgi:hypothetical protein
MWQNQATIFGRLLRERFDFPDQIPHKLEVLLCYLDGAERRRLTQTRLNTPMDRKFASDLRLML